MKALLAGLLTSVALFGSTLSFAQPIAINNGVTGDGSWQVAAGEGGDSRVGILDPAGPVGPSNVIFDLSTLVDTGANGGAIALSQTTITSPPVLTAPGQVSSSGTFAGANGPVNWNSVSRIAPGSLVYQNSVTFTSSAPFGSLRVICYLDEDVLGSSDDIMVLFGTAGQSDFNVLTVDNTDNFGVAHAAGYLTSPNATYVGWAADEYSDLINAIANQGTSYSIPGVIDTTSLPPITDPRYPGRMVFGPNDITNAFAFDLNPTTTTATVACSLGGLPTGQPPALAISKTAAAAAAVGTDLVYTIRYANAGSSTAAGVAIRDRLPMGATFVAASNGGTLAGDTVTWAIGDLPANSGDRTLTLTVRVTGVAGSVITNGDYSISGTGISMVAGVPVSTTLTTATVVIPPIVPNASACSILPLPANVRATAGGLSSDANFVFFGVPNAARPDPRCTNLPDFCGPIEEVSIFNRMTQASTVITTNSPQGWDLVHGTAGNRAFIATDAIQSGVSFQYSGDRLSTVGYPILNNGQIVFVPARRGEILLADATSGSAMAIRTPFRTATTASGLAWSGHFVAAADGGNHVVLVEAAYDQAGVVVDGGLNYVNISAQTSFDVFNRIRSLGNIAPTIDITLNLQDSLSGDGNRFAFSASRVLTGPNSGTAVNQLPGNNYRLQNFAYMLDVPANRLTLVANPDLSRARPGGSAAFFVRSLGASGALVPLDRTVPFTGTTGNPEQNGEIYVAQPGIGITQVTNTALPRSGDYFSPGLAFITPNERYIYFQAQQDLVVGRNTDQSNELFRYDIQSGQLKQVTARFDAVADLLAALGISPTAGAAGVGQIVGDQSSFDGRFVLLYANAISTAVDLGSGARGVVAEGATLYDCQ